MADKPVVTTIASDSRQTAATTNANNDVLAEGVASCLGRGGTGEDNNSMTGNLDMDLHRIQNLPVPLTAKEAVNKAYVDGLANIGGAVDLASVSTSKVSGQAVDWDALNNNTIVCAFETYTELQGIDAFIDGDVVVVHGRSTSGDGGGGLFRWSVSDYSTLVTADTTKALYLPPTSDVTGASGAWVRLFSGVYDVRWFGANVSSTDNFSAFEAASTLVNYLGGGSVYVPPGEWKTQEAILVRSGVYFIGDGPASWIHNTADNDTLSEVTLMLGNYKASGQVGDNFFAVDSYSMSTASAGDSTVTLTTSGDSTNFSVGDIVFLWSDDTTVWKKYQQMNEVTAVGTGTLTLKYPVYKNTTGLTMLVGIAGTGGITDYYGRSQDVCVRGGIMNLAVSSDNYRWTAGNALFEGIIKNVYVKKSQTLLACNGLAYCDVDNVIGLFSASGLNLAYMSHNTTVKAKGCWAGGTTQAATYGVLFEENAHNNTYTVDFDLGTQTAYPVRFTKASENNELINSRLKQNNPGSGYASIYASYSSASGSSSDAPRGGNKVTNCSFYRESVDTPFFSSTDDWNSVRQAVPNIVSGCTLYMPDYTVSTRALTVNTSDWHFCDIKSPIFGALLTTGAAGIKASRFCIDEESYTITDPDNVLLIESILTPTLASLKSAENWDFNHATTSSTTSTNVIASSTIPQGALALADRVDVSFSGRFLGSTSTMRMEVWAGGSKVAEVASTTAGGVDIKATMVQKNAAEQRWSSLQGSPTATLAAQARTFINTDSNDYTIELRAYVDNAADQIIPFDTNIRVRRQYM